MYKLIIILAWCVCSFILPVCASALPRRDPTRPPDVIYDDLPLKRNVQVDAVFNSIANASSSIAIIDGKSFVVGDRIAEATIVAINSQGIKLKDSSGEFAIPVSYLDIKSPTTTPN